MEDWLDECRRMQEVISDMISRCELFEDEFEQRINDMCDDVSSADYSADEIIMPEKLEEFSYVDDSEADEMYDEWTELCSLRSELDSHKRYLNRMLNSTKYA